MSITAMKRALEALDELSEPYDVLKAQDALRQAIKQAETQKPVVWMYQDKSTHEVRFEKHMRGFIDHGATYETALYTTPPQRTEQEPATLPHEMTPEMLRQVQTQSELGAYVAANFSGAYDLFNEFWRVAIAAAPQRTWVGLTAEDKNTADLVEAEVEQDWIDGYLCGLKDAEAKLKEKNT